MSSRRKQAHEAEGLVESQNASAQVVTGPAEADLSTLMKQLVRARESVAKALRRVRSEASLPGRPQQEKSEALEALLAARREANQVRSALIARLGYAR